MKFWLLDIILKLFAPVMEMHYTTQGMAEKTE